MSPARVTTLMLYLSPFFGICVGVSVFGVVANDLFAIAVDMVRVDFGVTYRAEMDVVKAYAEDIGAMVVECEVACFVGERCFERIPCYLGLRIGLQQFELFAVGRPQKVNLLHAIGLAKDIEAEAYFRSGYNLG